MGRLDELRKFKRKWGYDDFHVGTGGRMVEYGVTDDLRDRVVKNLMAVAPEKAAIIRAATENPEAVNLDTLKGLLEKAEADHGELIDEVGREAERIRYNTGSPSSDLIRRIAAALGDKHPKRGVLDEWANDLDNPYDPMQTEFAVSMMNRVRDRGTVDRTAAIDQVADKIYSTDRKAELLELTKGTGMKAGHYLAKAYGLRTIKDMSDDPRLFPADKVTGIRNLHENSSVYQRDSLKSGLNKLLKGLYNTSKKAAVGKGKKTLANGDDLPDLDAERMFFVNGPSVVKRLDNIYTPEWIDPADKSLKFKQYFTEVVELDTNIHVILMTTGKASAKDLDVFQRHLLAGSGSTPSAYAIEKASAPSKGTDLLGHTEMLDDSQPPNDAHLDQIAKSGGTRSLETLPDSHPMKQTAQAAANMVTGLQKALATLGSPKDAQFRQNKLVKSALDKIGRLMQVMPTYTEDTPRFSKLFDLLVDEVYLVLATCKPYSADSFQAATDKMTEDRIPILTDTEKLPNAQHKTFLLSSGMGATSAAVEAAYARTGSNKLHLVDNNAANSHSANYFEIEMHLIGESVQEDAPKDALEWNDSYKPPVIMATLNPSTPTKPEKEKDRTAWSVDTLNKNIRAVLDKHDVCLRDLRCTGPAVAVIDATVERDGTGADQEMNRVVAAFASGVNEGRLEFMFVKSYQKYPSLGAGKAMAGGVTIIGNKPAEGEPMAGEP